MVVDNLLSAVFCLSIVALTSCNFTLDSSLVTACTDFACKYIYISLFKQMFVNNEQEVSVFSDLSDLTLGEIENEHCDIYSSRSCVPKDKSEDIADSKNCDTYSSVLCVPPDGSEDIDYNENCEIYSSGLCVPQDRLEDIEFFPNFNNDSISIFGYLDFDSPKHETISTGEFSTPEDFQSFQEIDAKEKLDFCSSLQTKEEKRKRDSIEEFMTTEIDKKRKLGDKNRVYEDGIFMKKSILRQNERRCSHCQANKTPQWRMGPMGPNTLCNACGVRYKSGRLFPEYRPAASPTFDRLKHSNSHKKVLQLQRKYKYKRII